MVPYSDVNIGERTAHNPQWGSDSSLSEVTTVQLEFKYIAHLTNRPEFRVSVDKTMDIVNEQVWWGTTVGGGAYSSTREYSREYLSGTVRWY